MNSATTLMASCNTEGEGRINKEESFDNYIKKKMKKAAEAGQTV
jgi:hypothetical protein